MHQRRPRIDSIRRRRQVRNDDVLPCPNSKAGAEPGGLIAPVLVVESARGKVLDADKVVAGLELTPQSRFPRVGLRLRALLPELDPAPLCIQIANGTQLYSRVDVTPGRSSRLKCRNARRDIPGVELLQSLHDREHSGSGGNRVRCSTTD
jgi:hypothetical protein